MFRGKKWLKRKKTVEERNRIHSESSKKGWRSRKRQRKAIGIDEKIRRKRVALSEQLLLRN